MILKLLMELVIGLLDLVFGWVSFPPMPDAVVSATDFLFTHMENAMGFLWLFVPRELVIIILPIVLVVENFDKVYGIVMWILKKIPFLNMK